VGADLRMANLQDTNLKNCIFCYALLAKINLVESCLHRVTMIDGSLFSADLKGANLRNSALNGVNLRSTIMPDGSIHP